MGEGEREGGRRGREGGERGGGEGGWMERVRGGSEVMEEGDGGGLVLRDIEQEADVDEDEEMDEDIRRAIELSLIDQRNPRQSASGALLSSEPTDSNRESDLLQAHVHSDLLPQLQSGVGTSATGSVPDPEGSGYGTGRAVLDVSGPDFEHLLRLRP